MDFSSLFPNFTSRCGELKSILTPVAFLFMVIGMVAATATGRRSAGASLRTFGRTIVLIILLTQIVSWGNQIALITDTTVKDVLKADPSNVYEKYKHSLEVKKSQTDQASWWEKLFNFGASVFEAFISALLWFLGFLASIIVFYAYLVQKFIIYLGYALSPIFIGFLAVRSLNQIGSNYLLGLVGVMLWPLGWGAASLVTEGLLDFMTDQSFISDFSVAGAAGYAFQNFIGVAVIGVWLIFSTIAAPIIIQRAIAAGAQIGSALISGAVSAATASLATGAAAAGAIGAAGGAAAFVTGTIGGAAAAGATLAGTSLNGSSYSPTGSLIASLGQMTGRSSSRSKAEEKDDSKSSPRTPAALDATGDNAVQSLLRKSQNPHS